MSNTPNNPLLSFLSNPTILEFLKSNAIFGNIMILFFLVTTVFSILNIQPFLQVTANDDSNKCDKFNEKVKSLLGLQDTNLIKSSSIDTSTQKENTQFSCIYTIYNSSKTSTYTSKFNIISELLGEDHQNINERKVKQADLDRYCEEKFSKSESESKEYYIEKKAILLSSPENVYPVFRWKCQYTRIPKSPSNRTRPGESSRPKEVGIDFDNEKFCDVLFQNKSYVLRYHYYYDPYSLYCTDPNF